MRRLYVVSVLLGMTALVPSARAQNYVPTNNYGGADVVVNMDTLGAQPNYPLRSTPSYQRPLPPPVALRAPRQFAPQAPLQLRPPMPHQRVASMPSPAAPVPVAPPSAPKQMAAVPVVPMAEPAPISPRLADAPSADRPIPVSPVMKSAMVKPAPAMPPAEVVEAKPVLPPPPMDEMGVPLEPVKPAPFEARDVAELAPPPASIPQPESLKASPPADIAAAKAEDKKIDEPKKAGVVADKNDFAETPVVENVNGTDQVKAYGNPSDEPKKAAVVADKKDFTEKPVITTMDEKPAVPAEANNPARTLLAQARDKANTDDNVKREVVLFDDAPKTEKPLKAPPSAILKPTPLNAAPAPKMAAIAPASPPPAAMPAPMPLTPAKPAPIASAPAAVAPAPAVSSSGEKVAMLKPTPINQTPPALKAAETQVDDFEAYRLVFDGASVEVKPSEQAVLDNIVKKLQSEPNTRLQLRAYANGTPDTSAQSRRVSLSRALNVRTYLVQKGITTTRLDVRALGNGSAAMGDQVGKGNTPPDRVDVIFVR